MEYGRQTEAQALALLLRSGCIADDRPDPAAVAAPPDLGHFW